MHGQWVGRYEGTNTGELIIDIDHCGDHFSGSAVVFDDENLPGSFVTFRTTSCDPAHAFEGLQVGALDPVTGNFVDLDELKARYTAQGLELQFPRTADVKIGLDSGQLRAEWTTDVGSAGTAVLPPSRATAHSDVIPEGEVKSWSDFKKIVSSLPRERFIFRGQPSPWRLRTAFHRTSRKDLFPFMNADIPRLHRVLSGLTRHHFHLADAQQNGAFWNLVQHHGYPTPLLDWSHSPFVAAFFAYRNKLQDDEKAPTVRIYAFDRATWCADYRQLWKLAPTRPHFSILESVALENPRMVPQQALSSITNMDDIEAYIRLREGEKGKTYLLAYDLPAKDVKEVLSDLGMMGIAAGALFPGLDGVCEEMKYRAFGYQG
jgi:hypothetical protein